MSSPASSSGLAIVALVSRNRGIGAVDRGDSPQPPQHVRDVRAEHAAVDVGLVDHDEREVREQLVPSSVVGQDPDVEHVRVREDQVAASVRIAVRSWRGVSPS